MTYANFSDRLISLRKEQNLSQVKLAKQLNTSRKTVMDWEHNRVLPSFDSIIALARIFDVSADYILGISDEAASMPR